MAGLRQLAVAGVVAGVAVAGVPIGADAAGTHRHAAMQVRHYDHGLLSRTNDVRRSYGRHHYRMNRRLWRIAHAYAEHLARTGRLAHNPRLVSKVSHACPQWSAIGENVGVESGSSPRRLFRAYMHSPPHRANLLDSAYTQVGVASVQVHRHGRTKQYNVIDFSNHCPR